MNAALEKALNDIEKVKNNVKRIAALNTARLAQANMAEIRKALETEEAALARHMGKKPKQK